MHFLPRFINYGSHAPRVGIPARCPLSARLNSRNGRLVIRGNFSDDG